MTPQEEIAAIVGLGNPGKQYECTRHNAGFQVVDLLVSTSGASMQERKFRGSWGYGSIAGRKVLLLKPLTFMNRSGEAVGEVVRYFGLTPRDLLVIHDDLDLPTGFIRVARRGGTGGHRGIASIVEHLGSNDFPRLKLGIGRPQHHEPVESYVLQSPYATDAKLFQEMISTGADVVGTILSEGISAAMNKFNKRASSEPQSS